MSVDIEQDFTSTIISESDLFTVTRNDDTALNETWYTVAIPNPKPHVIALAMDLFAGRGVTAIESELTGSTLYLDFA